MAVIPDPAGLKRSGVNPNKSVVSLENSGAEGLATANLAVAVGTGASRVARMALYQADQMDTQQAKDAELKLREGVLELSKEAMSVQGKDAYTQGSTGYNAVYEDKFKSLQTGIASASKLSENGLVKFNEAAKTSALNFRAKRYQHSMTQEDAHKTALFSKGLDVTLNEAITADNANITAGKMIQGELEIIAEFKRQGITDPAIVDHAVLLFKSKVHGGIVDRLLANGDSGGAVAYIQTKQKAGELTGEQSTAMMKVVKPDVDYNSASVTANDAASLFGNGGSEGDALALIDKNSTNRESRELAHSLYGRKKAAIVSERGILGAKILGDYKDGSGKGRADPRLPEYKKMDPKGYETIITSMNAMDASAASGALPPKPTPEQEDAFYRIRGTGPMGRVTDEDLDKNRIHIGRHLWLKGVEENRQLKNRQSDAKLAALDTFSLDPQQRKLGYPDDSSTDERMVIDGQVADTLKRFINSHQRVPNPEEQREIILSATREYNVRDKSYGLKTRQMMSYEMKGKDNFPDQVYYWPENIDELFPQGTNPEEKAFAWGWIELQRKARPKERISDSQGVVEYAQRKRALQDEEADIAAKRVQQDYHK